MGPTGRGEAWSLGGELSHSRFPCRWAQSSAPLPQRLSSTYTRIWSVSRLVRLNVRLVAGAVAHADRAECGAAHHRVAVRRFSHARAQAQAVLNVILEHVQPARSPRAAAALYVG